MKTTALCPYTYAAAAQLIGQLYPIPLNKVRFDLTYVNKLTSEAGYIMLGINT